MTGKYEEYRQKVAGTNIDQRSLLSTDYFNTFNSVVMVMDMLPEMPELIDEIEQWRFSDYAEHFTISGLDFAPLAIEAYEYVPQDLRGAFERKINAMRILVEEAARTLRRLLDAGELDAFGAFARMFVTLFRQLMEEGHGIVHGNGGKALSQNAIDDMF